MPSSDRGDAQAPASISFVLPCMDEEITLPIVLGKIRQLREGPFAERAIEIVVADSSTDSSRRIAEEHGARVVACRERGYGAALLQGISAARNDLVIFADADDTYDLLEAPRLVEELERHGHEVVYGDRLRGVIEPGAMPALHRHVGTPVLNHMINVLFARHGTRVTDCNSGFRCFRRESFAAWGIESRGMEFATNMMIRALKARARMGSVPITLHADHDKRQPKLRRWRDGMRNLLGVLLEAPHLFHAVGWTAFLTCWALLLGGLFIGQRQVGFMTALGLHTMLFALLGSCVAVAVWNVGLLVAVRGDPVPWPYRWLLSLDEGALFWSATGFAAGCFTLFGAIVIRWALGGFENLSLEQETLVLTALATDGLLLLTGVVTAHLMRQLLRNRTS